MKEAISTVNSPRPAGQYSQGLRADGLIFVAGQGPRNPASRLLPEGIEARTHQVLRNIRGTLHAGGSSMTDVVKERAHLADLADSDAFNAVRGKHFQEPYPVRTTVGSQLAGILVELDAIAVCRGRRNPRNVDGTAPALRDWFVPGATSPHRRRIVEGRLLYLTHTDVAALDVPMAAIIEAVHAAFLEKGAGRVEMPPKPGVHPGPREADNFIHAMPAYIPALRSVGVKWVSGYPGNAAHGLPYINGLIILNDPDTGVPTAVMDCTWITAKRTAAASAVSARYLARPDSAVLGVLGCGVQGRSHVEALTIVLPGIKRVVAYDVDLKRAQTFADEIEQRHGIQAQAVPEPREAVRGADVVVTAGPILRVPHATIKAGWLEPGTFASAVDFDSYFDGAALHECAKFTTDDVAQLLHFRDMGYFQSVPAVYAELADLVAGHVPGRQSAEERTMAVNLGLALEDIAVAPLVYAKAQEAGVGRWLPL